MKTGIHPTYYPEAKVTCACGNTFIVGSTKPILEVEVCSNCHPFYTGQDKAMDNVGRVQKFKERMAKKQESPKKKTKTPKSQTVSRTQGKARVTTKAKKGTKK
jgi:large subunit ribosomal protein L31